MEAIAESIDITPSHLVPTACHGTANEPSQRIAIPFEANILALREGGRVFVIASLDWFFISPNLRDRVLAKCSGRLVEADLLVVASHAHTSPATDRTKVGFSAVEEQYVAGVEKAVAQCIDSLIQSGKWVNARLRFAAVACDCSIHRRRRVWTWKGVRLGRATALRPNPSGPRDRELRALRIEGQDGSIIAVMWGVSCHPVEWPRQRELSPDYPGGVRQELRILLGEKVPVLFLQGFAGDLRPPAIGRWPKRGKWRHRVRMFLLSIAQGPIFVGFSPKQYRVWMMHIAECAKMALNAAAVSPPVQAELAIKRASVPLSALGLSGDVSTLVVHQWDIHDRLKVVCMSAEVCWEYAGMLNHQFPGKTIWPVGYAGSVFGYLPTESMLGEGGYEVSGFKRAFGIKGAFHPGLEEVIRKALTEDNGMSEACDSGRYSAPGRSL
jgi:neutral ceramidase